MLSEARRLAPGRPALGTDSRMLESKIIDGKSVPRIGL
jgi:hypothetical protein